MLFRSDTSANVDDPHARAAFTGDEAPAQARRVRFGAAVVATGAPPFVPPIPGADGPGVLDSDTVWGLQAVPARLAVIGAGAIGMEMAQIFADFGSNVLVLEAQARPLAEVEDEIARSEERRVGKECRSRWSPYH